MQRFQNLVDLNATSLGAITESWLRNDAEVRPAESEDVRSYVDEILHAELVPRSTRMWSKRHWASSSISAFRAIFPRQRAGFKGY